MTKTQIKKDQENYQRWRDDHTDIISLTDAYLEKILHGVREGAGESGPSEGAYGERR
ncbi:MAG: hypothetical protein HZA17_15490 [Nitrospirae bacterium]|nr:hypothetical protein [Nitrospirota bacterium]